MNVDDVMMHVSFRYSPIKHTVSLQSLVSNCINFLDSFGEEALVGSEFYEIIGDGDGESRFQRLLSATGFSDDPHGFFKEFLNKLEQSNYAANIITTMNSIRLPNHFIMSLLEIILPGRKVFEIKKVKRLEKLCNITVPQEERNDLQKVLELFPVKLSTHTIRQMFISSNIAYQYMPFVGELDKEGLVHTWVGQFHRGIIEQMYKNRVIFLLNMNCPVYCRFCFRKHKECRNQKAPTKSHVIQALIYIKSNPSIKEIVMTGGDPLMNKPTLIGAIDGLLRIPHIQTLRIATRSISYYPDLFYSNNSFWLNYLKMKSLELRQKGKNLEIGTHFIHPDEISLQSLDIISELVKNGVSVYVQTPFLNGCNDKAEVLTDLFSQLRAVGAEMHYIFIPCSPIQGNKRYQTSIDTALTTFQQLRAQVSDRAIPHLCTATPIGKIDWNVSGWAVEVDEDDHRYLWLRTPYTTDYFESFAPILQLSKISRINNEGTLDIKFMADIGDERHLLGSMDSKIASVSFDEKAKNTERITRQSLPHLQDQALQNQRNPVTLINTSSSSLFRIHKTCVEIDWQAQTDQMLSNLEYIEKDRSITDVIIASQKDCIESLNLVEKLVRKLHNIQHITAIRLRSLRFNYSPELYTRMIIKKLGELNKLSIVDPKRLEIETQFIHSSEFRSDHKTVVDSLAQQGITVYNNTPLLSFINDSGEEIHKISYLCRQHGIEFHNLYIAGLPIQESWSEEYAVYITQIVDIAGFVRKFGSGREVPRYVLKTGLGDVNFDAISELFISDDDGNVAVKLLPYTLEYYQEIEPDFQFPTYIETGDDGHPIVPVKGLKKLIEDFIQV